MAHTIALHLPSAEHRACVVAALRRVAARVTVHVTAEAALDALADGWPAEVLVTALRDAAGQPVSTLLRRVHSAFPDVTIVAYGSLTPQFARDLLDAAACSVSEVALHDFDDIASLASRLIDRATGRRVADVALAAVDDRLSRVQWRAGEQRSGGAFSHAPIVENGTLYVSGYQGLFALRAVP